MRTLKTLSTLALSVTLLCGCVANKNAIFTINEEPVTQAEFDKSFEQVSKNPMMLQLGINLKEDPNSMLNMILRDRVVNELIVKKLIDQDIKKNRIKVTSEDVDKELKTIIDQIGSKEKFNEILKQNGLSASEFKKDLEEEVKVKKLIEIVRPVRISDKDAEKFYKSNIDTFKHGARVKASHILVAANKDEIKTVITADEANKNLTPAEIEAKVKADLAVKYDRAKKLLDEVKKDPTQFAKIAKENSDDPGSAREGGDLGYFTKEQMVDEFSKAAFSQKPSTISDIVVSPFGYHIIMVTDRQEAGVESFDKVKDNIKAFLENKEKVEALEKHVTKLKNEANIVFTNPDYDPANIQKKIKERASEEVQETLKKGTTK